MGKYIPLAVRRAQAYATDAAQLRHGIEKIREIERLRMRLLATPDTHTHEVAAPNYDGGGKPVKYSLWKRFADTLVTGYAPIGESDSVQIYCIHCQLPFDAALTQRIAIGVVTEYDELETKVAPMGNSWEWDDEEVTRIRPAIVKGDGCPACAFAYAKAQANAKRLTTRIVYTVDGEKRSLLATDIRHGSSLLAEVMGRVELVSCKRIPERQGFLNVRVRVSEFTPDPKVIARDYEHRALALARLEAIQQRTDKLTAAMLADNIASKIANRRRDIKARLKVFAKPLRCRIAKTVALPVTFTAVQEPMRETRRITIRLQPIGICQHARGITTPIRTGRRPGVY